MSRMGVRMAVELNGRVWKKFVKFFRTEKGYENWTEDEIEDSRNDDDTTEFLEWLVKELESEMILRHEVAKYLAIKLETESMWGNARECKKLRKLLDQLGERD